MIVPRLNRRSNLCSTDGVSNECLTKVNPGSMAARDPWRPGRMRPRPDHARVVVSTGDGVDPPRHLASTWKPTYPWLRTSRHWTKPLPINAYVVEHRDGIMLFDTARTGRRSPTRATSPAPPPESSTTASRASTSAPAIRSPPGWRPSLRPRRCANCGAVPSPPGPHRRAAGTPRCRRRRGQPPGVAGPTTTAGSLTGCCAPTSSSLGCTGAASSLHQPTIPAWSRSRPAIPCSATGAWCCRPRPATHLARCRCWSVARDDRGCCWLVTSPTTPTCWSTATCRASAAGRSAERGARADRAPPAAPGAGGRGSGGEREDFSPRICRAAWRPTWSGARRGPVGAVCGDRTQLGKGERDGDPGAEDRPGPWRRCGVHPPDVPTLRQAGGPDLSQLLRAGPRPRRARATTRRGGETWRWRQELTATPRPTSAAPAWVLPSLRRAGGGHRDPHDLVLPRRPRRATRRNRSRAGWCSGQLRGVARLLGRQETTLGVCEQPSLAGRPDRAVDPGCARLCHAETLVRPPLTWGVHGHRRNAWPLRLRPSHLRRTQWPPTTIAAMTAAVLSSGCRWARPWRLWRARAAVGTPGGSSLCR